jgi:molybdate transport system substrate-binding protein
MWIARGLAGLMIVATALAGCGRAGATAAPATLTVLAAASLTDAFTELGAAVEAAHPGVTVAFSFAGSNALAQQLIAGAPADVFASANGAQMAAVIEGGRVAEGSERVFARNRLVVIFPSDNPGRIETLADLATPGLTLVLAAAEVPVGQYALDFLDRASENPMYGAGYREGVLANVVSYETNVRTVYTKVALGEADAGLVYSSDAAGDGAGDVGQLDIPNDLNTIAAYPIAALADAREPALAQAYVDLICSAAGQTIMAKYGFIPAQ